MKIRELRKSKKLSLEDLAHFLGTSNQTISNWENEKTEPDVKSIKKLAGFFGVTTDYLLDYQPEGLSDADLDEIYECAYTILSKIDNAKKQNNRQ